MPTSLDILHTLLAILSVPAVAAGTNWLSRRFSKEARLMIRLERLTAIYPNLPPGPVQTEFGRRVAEAGAELNVRLDPLFKRERRRKRKVILGMLTASTLAALITPPQAGASESTSTTVSLVLGGLACAGFMLIERDTRRQRAAIAARQDNKVRYQPATPRPVPPVTDPRRQSPVERSRMPGAGLR